VRRYETIFVSHPDLTEEALEELTQNHGEMIQLEQWGKKKLAYKIQKSFLGHYTYLDYAALPDAVNELERVLRLDDMVLKYLTVKLDDRVDLEAVRRSVEEKQKASAQSREVSLKAKVVEESALEPPKEEEPAVRSAEEETPGSEVKAEGEEEEEKKTKVKAGTRKKKEAKAKATADVSEESAEPIAEAKEIKEEAPKGSRKKTTRKKSEEES
jgi:small subunit ribosomal protein S6